MLDFVFWPIVMGFAPVALSVLWLLIAAIEDWTVSTFERLHRGKACQMFKSPWGPGLSTSSPSSLRSPAAMDARTR
jgi:hypothetical protein